MEEEGRAFAPFRITVKREAVEGNYRKPTSSGVPVRITTERCRCWDIK